METNSVVVPVGEPALEMVGKDAGARAGGQQMVESQEDVLAAAWGVQTRHVADCMVRQGQGSLEALVL
jgi:hypothetical protein